MVSYMKVEKRIVKTLAAFALICSLSVSAHAQLGSGWTSAPETPTPQTSSGCTITPNSSGGGTFSVPSGIARAEYRYPNLPTTGTSQFQGDVVYTSLAGNRVNCEQLFGPAPSTPWQMLAFDKTLTVAGNPPGAFYDVESAAKGAQPGLYPYTIGATAQVNTIYDPVADTVDIYINGTHVRQDTETNGTSAPNPPPHYHKIGCYVTGSGSGPATTVWTNVQFWSGGTIGPGTVATPTFSPAGGTYSSAQSVSISDSTSGATIYYTTNGTTPTTSSTVYSSAIAVSSGTVTIEALGVASGDTNSSVASATYTISTTTTVATPTFSPAGGTYSSAQSVSISDSTSGATIYYTTNGSTPTTSSTVYSGAIAVSGGTATIEAIAAKSGDTTSSVASATYTISTATTVATPTFSPAGGTYTSAQSVSLSDSTSGATIYYTTNGTTPTTSSTVYSGAIAVSSSTVTIEALAAKSGDNNSSVASATYTISSGGGNEPAPTFSEPTGTYVKEVHTRISDTDANAAIYYTTDGSTPTSSSTPNPDSTIEFKTTTTLKSIAIDNGVSSPVTTATYTITP
jgi:hypothetical protein